MINPEGAHGAFEPFESGIVPGLVVVGDDAEEKLFELTRGEDTRPIDEYDADFDGAFTRKQSGIHSSAWVVARGFMVGNNGAEHAALYKTYRALEKANAFDSDSSYEWNHKAALLLPGIPYERYVNELLVRTRLKLGSLALVETVLSDPDIPFAFVSSGLKPTIQRILADKQIPHPADRVGIYANDFEVVDGVIANVNLDEIVHSTNKVAYPPADERPRRGLGGMAIIMGDEPHDSRISGRPADEVFRIRADGGMQRIIDGSGEAGFWKFLADSRAAGYDAVTLEDNLYSPTMLVELNLRARGIPIVRHTRKAA